MNIIESDGSTKTVPVVHVFSHAFLCLPSSNTLLLATVKLVSYAMFQNARKSEFPSSNS